MDNLNSLAIIPEMLSDMSVTSSFAVDHPAENVFDEDVDTFFYADNAVKEDNPWLKASFDGTYAMGLIEVRDVPVCTLYK